MPTHPTRSRRIMPTTRRGTSYVVHHGDQPMVQLLLPMEPALRMQDHLEAVMVKAGSLLAHAYLQDEAKFLAGPKYTHGDGKPVYFGNGGQKSTAEISSEFPRIEAKAV